MLVVPQLTHPLVQLRAIQASDLPTWAEYLHLESVCMNIQVGIFRRWMSLRFTSGIQMPMLPLASCVWA